MENTLKLNITINSEIGDIRTETIISKTIFSEYNYIFDYDEIIEDLKTAFKINKKFRMLTIDFLINGELENSYRVINEYGGLKGCKMNFDRKVFQFDNFEIINKKEINLQVKNITEFANKRFIELIKTNV